MQECSTFDFNMEYNPVKVIAGLNNNVSLKRQDILCRYMMHLCVYLHLVKCSNNVK